MKKEILKRQQQHYYTKDATTLLLSRRQVGEVDGKVSTITAAGALSEDKWSKYLQPEKDI